MKTKAKEEAKRMLKVIEENPKNTLKVIKDRISKVFCELEKQKVKCEQNYWCCQTCGSFDIAKNYENNLNYDGYCFYHSQDYDELKTAKYTYLSYGGFRDNNMLNIGNKIVKAFKKEGIKVTWNGDINTRILIEF